MPGSTTKRAILTDNPLKNIKYSALAMLSKLCRYSERFADILITSLTTD